MKMRFFLVMLLLTIVIACTPEPATEQSTPPDNPVAASNENPTRGQVKAEIGGARISIDYGRPALEGRDMLSRLPDGEVWRLGMDAATSLETTAALAFGDQVVDAGSYTLFLRKISPDEWHLLVNSQTGIWGTAHNSEFDIAEIPLEKSENSESVERFTIEVQSTGDHTGQLVFEWGDLKLLAAFEIQGQ